MLQYGIACQPASQPEEAYVLPPLHAGEGWGGVPHPCGKPAYPLLASPCKQGEEQEHQPALCFFTALSICSGVR